MDNLLEIRNLTIELPQGKKKAPIKLVDGVDLNIKKKQNFGVVGESGCGKSITCSAIMSLLSYPLNVGKGSSIRFQKEDGTEVLETIPGAVADRSVLYGAQTPQIFHSEILKAAYSQAYDTAFTDDASVVEKYGKSLSYTMGERLNIKITTQDDLVLANAVMNVRKN